MYHTRSHEIRYNRRLERGEYRHSFARRNHTFQLDRESRNGDSPGSGDVLTGIIGSLLSQGYSPEDAAIIGVYLHGVAGDIAARESGEEYITASDIINHLGLAFKQIKSYQV